MSTHCARSRSKISADVERLRRAAWWDWPAELVTEHARTIMAGTPADIACIAAEHGSEAA